MDATGAASVKEAETRVIVSFPHPLLDGWSASRVFGEVFATYSDIRAGTLATRSRGLPYRAYIAWLGQQDEREAEEFWRAALKGFGTPTPLWGDKVQGQSASEDKRAVVVERRLTLRTTSRLEGLTRTHGLTLNTITQGVWALLLSRYSGEPDVVFGVVTSGRPSNLPGALDAVGLFINTLPLRVLVAPEKDIITWLTEIQDWNAELRRHEYSTLAQIQSWSDVPAGRPLFESLFSFETYPLGGSEQSSEGHPLHVRDVHGWDTDNFPLSLTIVPGRELSIQVNYETRRFDAATIDRVIDQYAGLLDKITASPLATVGELSVLTDNDRRLVLESWNEIGRAHV